MKTLAFFILSLFLFSCSSINHKRNLASVSNIELYQVGEIKISMLEIDEFKDNYGPVWTLMDGRNVGGSEYASLTASINLPDARGKFLRMNNNGAKCEEPQNCDFDPDADRALGSFQKDMAGPHIHNHRGAFTGVAPGGGHALGFQNETNKNQTFPNKEAETRPKNISVNYYVKINSCKAEYEVCL